MAILTAAQVHFDQPLTNMSIAYLQSTTAFVADRVFPKISVDKKSNRYYIYDRAAFNRTGEVRVRAPGTIAPEVSLTLSTDTYTADVRSLAALLPFEVLNNEDTALSIRQANVELLTMKLLIDKEIQWANNFFVATPWGTQWTGVSGVPAASQVRQWNDYVNSTPIADVISVKTTVQLKSGGFKPNVMVMGKQVYDQLMAHPTILARLNGGSTFSQPSFINLSKLAEIFEMDEILVMESVQNTAAEGLTESNAFIGGKSVLFVYRPNMTMGMMTTAAGATFTWDELEHANGYGINIQAYSGDFLRERGIAEKLEANMSYAHKVVGADLGLFISTVIA